MLNWSTVIKYIRDNVSLPSTFFEKSDEEVKEYLKNTSLKEFSNYFPDLARTSVITNDPYYKHETKSNFYYFFDEEGCEIINIKECYFSIGNQYLGGHPFLGPLSFEGMSWWALGVFKSRFFQPFSMWSYNYHFWNPNIVEVISSSNNILDDNFLVEYERTQPSDLSRIPTNMHMAFLDLSLAHIMIMIGRLRSHYGNEISTPFGNIPLQSDTLKSDGEALRDKCISLLSTESLPPITIDVY